MKARITKIILISESVVRPDQQRLRVHDEFRKYYKKTMFSTTEKCKPVVSHPAQDSRSTGLQT